jgi:nickel-dependent lactate racemase
MIIDLPYSKGEVSIEIPDRNLRFLIDRGKLPAAKDIRGEVIRALRDPIACQPLSKLVRPDSKVVIVGDDLTRPTPQKIIMPAVLDELNSCGVRDDRIEVLIGLGTHRQMSEVEISEKYGKEVVERVRIHNHDYMDDRALVYMGTTESDIPVYVNRMLFDADFVMCIGNLVPHETAGWGGGGKGIQPGVCGEETTVYTHVMATKMLVEGRTMAGDPDNPMRKEIELVARKAGLRMILNTVLNEKNEVSKVFAGDLVRAHREGVEHAKRAYMPEVPSLVDAMIVACKPADIDYWQGLKPLAYASEVVKLGGSVVLVAEFPDGISPTHPQVRDMGRWSIKEVLNAIEDERVPGGDIIGASTMLLHAKIRERVEIMCYSGGMTEGDKEALGMAHVGSLEEALELVFRRYGRDASIGVMKSGDILPRVL